MGGLAPSVCRDVHMRTPKRLPLEVNPLLTFKGWWDESGLSDIAMRNKEGWHPGWTPCAIHKK